MHELKLSVIIPAFNEETNLKITLVEVQKALRDASIPYEIIVVNDNSSDGTEDVIKGCMKLDANVKLVGRTPPGGFGRAIRSGLEYVQGDAVAFFMADQSDDPHDLIKCYNKIEEGYDCVFGTRFGKESKVSGYPKGKLLVNRAVNKAIQIMFWTRHNDLTNAFKMYRTDVMYECGPFKSSHFNITIEMSLAALIRGYSIARVPINWEGRTSGVSNLRLTEMGRRYLSVLLKVFFERMLIADDLVAERLARQLQVNSQSGQLQRRIGELERTVSELQAKGPS